MFVRLTTAENLRHSRGGVDRAPDTSTCYGEGYWIEFSRRYDHEAAAVWRH